MRTFFARKQRNGRGFLRVNVVLLFVVPLLCLSQTQITLKNSFIQKYMNRVTMDISFIVDHAGERAKSISKGSLDGDLHIAGRAKEAGLPMVAEIMNAREEKPAMDLVHSVEGTTKTIKITGAWRLWCEHAGKSKQVQGKTVAKPKDTNPAHAFEIHPITQIENINLLNSLKVIPGYEAKDAETAFTQFNKKKFEIIYDGKKRTTTIITKQIGYNYVEFVMELVDERQDEVEDGRFVYANVLSLNRKLLAEEVRMVFVKDSEPENKVKGKRDGDTLHVLGIPRINLEEVWARVQDAKPEALKENLPFEMIIVGVY
jgi:hypothetical protein